MKLNIIGSFFGTSGYCNHVRGLSNSLAKHVDVKISTQLFQNWEYQVNDEELKMISKPDDKDRINIIIDLPFNWTPHLQKKHNIGFLVWEGDKIPESWTENILDDRVTQVWVPSTHVYNAIKNTFGGLIWPTVKNKIKLVPHGFDPNIFKPISKEKQPPFTFLVNKGFRNELDRGGVQHALKAFIQEFNKGEAKLFLKLNPAYVMAPEQLNQIITKYIQEAKKTPDQIGEIAFTYDNMPQNILNDLYNSVDVLLNPTEAEAFSLPCIESMACQVPVITTGFGGQTDFINESNGCLVNYQMHEIKHELIYEGINWAKPDIQGLRTAMRWMQTIKEGRETKAKKAYEDSKNWTWDNSALKAIESLNEINLNTN